MPWVVEQPPTRGTWEVESPTPDAAPTPKKPSPLELLLKMRPDLKLASAATELAKPAVLPMALGAGGAAIGTAIAPGPGTVIGESIGSMAGEGINQATGITKPSIGQIVAAGAAGPVVRGTAGGFRALKSFLAPKLPGASAMLNEEAIAQLRQIPGRYAPTENVDELAALVRQQRVSMATPNLRQAADELSAREASIAPGFREAKISLPAKGLKEKFFDPSPPSTVTSPITDRLGRPIVSEVAPGRTGQEPIPFQDLWKHYKRLNSKIHTTAETGGDVHGAMKYLKSKLLDDMEAAEGAAQGEAREALRRFNTTYKRQMAADELTDLIETPGKTITLPRKGDVNSLQAPRPMELLKAVERSETIQRALFPAELDDLRATLVAMQKLPPLPPVSGVPHGSGPTNKLIALLAGSGGLAGFAAGGPMGGAVGSSIGLAASAAPTMISKLLTTPAGRAWLRAQIGKGFTWDYPTLSAMAQMVRSQTTDEPPTTPNGALKRTLGMTDVAPQLRGTP